MTSSVTIFKGRTTILPVNVQYDVSQDEISSEIRAGTNPESPRIATWTVRFATDGKDGNLIFTLDNSQTEGITYRTGYMDIKRVSAGEPFNVTEDPIPVVFRNVVTQ
jgi:hypothetical protein